MSKVTRFLIFFCVLGLSFALPPDSTPLDDWSKQDVEEWIDSLNLPGLAPGKEFNRQNVRGSILPNIVNADSMTAQNAELFKELGIDDIEVRKKLQKRVFQEMQRTKDVAFRAKMKEKLKEGSTMRKDSTAPTVDDTLRASDVLKAPLSKVLAFIRSRGVDPRLVGTNIEEIRAEAYRLAVEADKERKNPKMKSPDVEDTSEPDEDEEEEEEEL